MGIGVAGLTQAKRNGRLRRGWCGVWSFFGARDDAKFLQFVTVFANSCGLQPSTGTAAIHIIAAVQ